MGAGAVGCYYGGMLSRAGHQVMLIGRAAHVEAIRRHGLLMDTTAFREYVPVGASTDVSAMQGASLVLCCIKSNDTENAAALMAPHLRADVVVLSLQNGIDNAERLQSQLLHAVYPAVVYVAAEMNGPGQLKHHGRGELVIGPSAMDNEMIEVFVDAGVPMRISDNVIGELWAKLILNCAYNALSAITKLPYGLLFEDPGAKELMRSIVRECLAVAQRESITVPGDSWQNVERIAATMPAQFSSTAQDLKRGRRGEIDHLNGYVVRKSKSLAIDTPVNQALYSIVKLLESAIAR
ncbi:MAG TPA: 2-dehydropantoate 2-reductase [Steroidobacteraceae bacterium]